MLAASIFASLLLFCAFASAQVSGSFGTGVAVTANTATTINYPDGAQLVITVDADASVIVNIVANTDVQVSFTQYTIGSLASAATTVGYSLDVSAGNIVSSTIRTAALNSVFFTAVQATGNVAGVLYYDSTTQGYLEVPATSQVAASTLTWNAMYKGRYVVAYRASTAAAAAAFNFALNVAANTATKVQYKSTTTTSLVITQTTTASSTFTARESSSAPSGSSSFSASGNVRISSYFDLSSTASSGISNNLEYTYTAADEAKADVSTFAWFYYNTATNAWEKDGTSSVDANARVVSHAATHFSAWVVAGVGSFSVSVIPAALLVAMAVLSMLMM